MLGRSINVEQLMGMRIGRGNGSTCGKYIPVPFFPLQILHDLTLGFFKVLKFGGGNFSGIPWKRNLDTGFNIFVLH
jgi:hypothetical protein